MEMATVSNNVLYAGTFDPITRGHLDLIERASSIFERVIVAVARDTRKQVLFDLPVRMEMVRESVRHLQNVEVDAFEGLLVDYARRRGCRLLLRGLRAFSDFEFEFQMTLTNRRLAPQIETLFLMPDEDFSYVSSSAVREIASLGGSAAKFVPPPVQKVLKARFKSRRPRRKRSAS